MRQIVAILGVMVVLAGVAASGATADPSGLKLRIAGKAQLVAPTAVLVPVTYDCPASNEPAFLQAGVFQPEEAAAFTEIPVEVPCTGRWATIDMLLFSPDPAFSLELGPADAFASIRHGPEGFDDRERKVRLVD